MESNETNSQDAIGESPGFSRRSVLKAAGAAGGAALVSGAFAGTAAAHQTQFFGCTQLCAGTDQDKAVVWNGYEYECRLLDKGDPGQYSDRNNIDWGGSFACLEVDEGEAVVGVLHRTDTECRLCVNPNRCAQNYYESCEQLITDLESTSGCCSNIEPCGDDPVYTSNGTEASGTCTNPDGSNSRKGNGYPNGKSENGNDR